MAMNFTFFTGIEIKKINRLINVGQGLRGSFTGFVDNQGRKFIALTQHYISRFYQRTGAAMPRALRPITLSKSTKGRSDGTLSIFSRGKLNRTNTECWI